MIRNEARVGRFGPDDARRVRDTEIFESQRNLSLKHVAFLREVMLAGQFDGGEPIRFAVLQGRAYLINGQHRLEAIAAGGGEQELVVVYSYCDTVEEVAQLYARIDRGRSRSIGDALHALGYQMDADGLTSRQMATVMACAPLFATELRSAMPTGSAFSSKSAENRVATMRPWMTAAQRFYAAVNTAKFGNDKMFLRRDVAAIGIATFADMPAADKALDFWGGMASDDGLAATDPRKQCLEYVRRTGPRRHSFLGQGVTTCWNAFYRSMPMMMVRVTDEKQPLKIMGTRFAKRRDDGSLDLSRPRLIA